MPAESTSMIFILVIMVGFFYMMIYRPQKKREKADRALRSSLKKGDEVVTIGGFVGTIMSVKEDEIVIETGASKTKLTIKKWAIQTRTSPVQEDEPEEEEYEDEAETGEE